eukprot:gnl/TRDRNA2_/TRDRNA2_130864_c0_seq2.p1 gnl/TRDRNA2_/TRDRNA2_130864_c0~~gnl/TRDRNA2_/TRDRNA2_130864_c0_seq2.p1  ORF type:complete len:580 (+),score=86.91 gnl/TRDRNA2_/TRDRNA2_130864_c0_seq2:37-1776(+)
MQDPYPALAEPLLQKAVPCGARCSQNVFTLFFVRLLIGLGFALLLNSLPCTNTERSHGMAVPEPAITMAWQTVHPARGPQIPQPAKFRQFVQPARVTQPVAKVVPNDAAAAAAADLKFVNQLCKSVFENYVVVTCGDPETCGESGTLRNLEGQTVVKERWLAASHDERSAALDILVKMLESGNNVQSETAAIALGEVASPGDPAVIRGLIDRINIPAWTWSAGKALGKMANGATEPQIVSTIGLSISDKKVADIREAINEGKDFTDSQNTPLQRDDVDAVTQILGAPIDLLVGDRIEKLTTKLIRIKRGLTSLLIHLLVEGSNVVGGNAATALGEVAQPRNPAVIRGLMLLIERADRIPASKWAAERAAKALGKVANGDQATITALITLLERSWGWRIPSWLERSYREPESEREVVVSALARVAPPGDPAVIRALMYLIERENSDVGKKAALVMGKVAHGDHATISALIALLQKGHGRSREFAAIALGEAASPGDQVVIRLLMACIEKYGRPYSDKREAAAISSMLSKVAQGDQALLKAWHTRLEHEKAEAAETWLVKKWLRKLVTGDESMRIRDHFSA